MANIVKKLIEEHKEVATLMQELGAKNVARLEVFQELHRSLLSHAKGEEAEFYPAVRDLDEELASKIPEAFEEHKEVERLLEQMTRAIDDDAEFKALLSELKENVEHHVEKEEGEVFPAVEQHLSAQELNDLGKRYLDAKQAAMESIGPVDPLIVKTKAELYEQAKEQDIPGRSQMSKEELAEELSKKGD
jgi:hemerythrin superfamily protein